MIGSVGRRREALEPAGASRRGTIGLDACSAAFLGFASKSGVVGHMVSYIFVAMSATNSKGNWL